MNLFSMRPTVLVTALTATIMLAGCPAMEQAQLRNDLADLVEQQRTAREDFAQSTFSPEQLEAAEDLRGEARGVFQERRDFVRSQLELLDTVELTEGQREQLAAILEAYREDLAAAAEAVQAAKDGLRAATLAEPPVVEEIDAAAGALGDAIGDAAVLVALAVDEARLVVTPEQEAILREVLENRVALQAAQRETVMERLQAFRENGASLGLSAEQREALRDFISGNGEVRQQLRETLEALRAMRS